VPGEKGPIGEIGRQGAKGEEGSIGIAGENLTSYFTLQYNITILVLCVCIFYRVFRTTWTTRDTRYPRTNWTERRARGHWRQR
jgi:hypothetical protein